MSAPTIPAFDPEGSDAEILEAFEKVRSHRARVYSFDHLAEANPAEFERITDELEPLDEQQAQDEKLVYGNWATTPSGVAAQLMLAATVECDRWVDIEMSQHGVLGLYGRLGDFDIKEKAIVVAANELLHIEWEQALTAWHAANSAYTEALALKSLVEGECIRARKAGEEPSDFLAKLEAYVEKAENNGSDCAALDRLIRTLAPDFAAYKRKADIALSEEYAREAAPWLVRDVNYLMGAMQPQQKAA